jgi:hypothetical protein
MFSGKAVRIFLSFSAQCVLFSFMFVAKWCFNFQIKELKEMSLSSNQEKSEMKKMTWKVEGDNGEQPSPVRGGPVDSSTLVVVVGPMEIRTFLLQF